jgi:ABC-type uncharacterized transport system ATPase subunit
VVLDGELKAIKRREWGNSYQLVAEGDLSRVQELPEVDLATVGDGFAKLILKPEASGYEVLPKLVAFLKVHEFRSDEPELEQIFLKAVSHAA